VGNQRPRLRRLGVRLSATCQHAPAPQRRAAPGAHRAPLPPPGQSYAAIDLGTNNCRLLIARPAGDGFVVVDAFSRVVRLGEGWRRRASGCGDGPGAGGAAHLRRQAAAARGYLARSVATEACRRAGNGGAFIERVRRETGIALDIISAREEARLAVLGCHILIEPGPGPALVFDIGGGSTELVLIDNQEAGAVPRILDFVSIPYGVVSLTESCGAEEEGEAPRRPLCRNAAPGGRRLCRFRRAPCACPRRAGRG
jgi:exopolyphosphatase/guanosine-5'-triphosphate,3'-diphosphate pyrophosphatase